MKVPVIRLGGGDFLYSPLSESVLLPAQAEPTRGLNFQQGKQGLSEYPQESKHQSPAKPPKSPDTGLLPPRQGFLYLSLDKGRIADFSHLDERVDAESVAVTNPLHILKDCVALLADEDGVALVVTDGINADDIGGVVDIGNPLDNLRGTAGEQGRQRNENGQDAPRRPYSLSHTISIVISSPFSHTGTSLSISS